MKLTDLKGYHVVAQATPSQDQNPTFAVPTAQSVVDAGKSIATGFAKDATETAIGTARLATQVGETVFPHVRFVNDALGDYNPLKGHNADVIDEQLTAKNDGERTGKVIGAVSSLFYPVGKAAEVQKATGAVLDGLGSRIHSMQDSVTSGGTSIKEHLIDAVSNLDDKTKTALKRTPQDVFQSFVQKGQAAMQDDRVRTPLEHVGDTVIEGLRTVAQKASEIGARKADLMKLSGITGFKGKALQDFNQGIQSFLNNKSSIEGDSAVVKSILSQFRSLGKTPSAGQVDKFIDNAQEALYASEKNLTLPVTTKTTGALRKLLGGLNENLKTQLPPEYRTLNEEYSKFASLSQELNTRLGKKGATAASLIKRLFSPSDARTKELFDELQKVTGQDYFRDARLAKFVMETLGDTRASSLLEQIPTSATGAVGKLVDFAKNKFADPLKAAGRFIEKNVNKDNKPNSSAFGAAAGLNKDENGKPTFDPLSSAVGIAAGGILSNGTKKLVVTEIRSHIARLEKKALATTNKTALNQLQKAIDEAKREVQKLLK